MNTNFRYQSFGKQGFSLKIGAYMLSVTFGNRARHFGFEKQPNFINFWIANPHYHARWATDIHFYFPFAGTQVCLHDDGYGHPDLDMTHSELIELGGWVACEVCDGRMYPEGHWLVWFVRTWRKIVNPVRWYFKGFRSDLLYTSTRWEMIANLRPVFLFRLLLVPVVVWRWTIGKLIK